MATSHSQFDKLSFLSVNMCLPYASPNLRTMQYFYFPGRHMAFINTRASFPYGVLLRYHTTIVRYL